MNVIQSNNKTILVVDDDPAVCDMMTAILSRDNYQVVSTVHSKEINNYIRQGSYVKIDLVITDLQMPGYGGFSIIKDLQAEEFKDIPILVVTGRNLDAQAVGLIQMESNVKGVFKKPLTISDFLSKVREILGDGPPPQTAKSDVWDEPK